MPRTLIIAGASSEATIAESYVSPHADVYLLNAVTEVVLGSNAKVDHYKQQMESVNAMHVATMQVMAARDSKFFSHAFAFGGRIARSDANAVMQGENCEVTLNGLYLGRGEQLIDNHTVMDHAMPHCRSFEIYADDVKCTHGATIGQLDEDALFYLRARGIAEEDARDILIGAFASEVLNNVKIEALRVRLQNELLTRLRRALD